MKNRQLIRKVKNQIRALFIATAYTLASAGASHAMSSLISLSQEPIWPASSTPDGNLLYNVTAVGRAGSGLLEVVLTAGGMPPGVTVTFSPSTLRFTGNQLIAQTATMTVSCPSLMPIDSFPFTITGTALRESITITNQVCFTAAYLATRLPTLMLDTMTNGNLRLRGAGATGKTYQIEATLSLSDPVWTPLGSATADGNGRFTFFTTPPTDPPMRFFRAVTTSP
jgi:hypothetical protein